MPDECHICLLNSESHSIQFLETFIKEKNVLIDTPYFESAAETFLFIIKNKLIFNEDTNWQCIKLILEIAFNMICSKDFNNLNNSNKVELKHLIEFIFNEQLQCERNFVSTFSNLLKIYKQFNVETKQIIRYELLNLYSVNINLELVSVEIKNLLRTIIDSAINLNITNNNTHATIKIILNLIIQDLYDVEKLIYHIIMKSIDSPINHIALSENLRSIICILHDNIQIYRSRDNDNFKFSIICNDCDNNIDSCTNEENLKHKICNNDYTTNYIHKKPTNWGSFEQDGTKFFKLFLSSNVIVRKNVIKALPPFLMHMPKLSYDCLNEWIKLFIYDETSTCDIYDELSHYIYSIHNIIQVI